MTKLNWEKDPYQRILSHQRKLKSQKDHLARKATRLRKIEKEQQAPYQRGLANGKAQERERILKLIKDNMEGRDSWLDVIELIEVKHDDR